MSDEKMRFQDPRSDRDILNEIHSAIYRLTSIVMMDLAKKEILNCEKPCEETHTPYWDDKLHMVACKNCDKLLKTVQRWE